MEIDRPIAIAVIIFIIILLMYFFVVPKYYEFRSLQVELGKVQAEYNGKYLYYSEVGTIFEKLEGYKEVLDKIDNAISPKPQLADLVYFFQQKGAESGLIIKSILLSKISPVASNKDNIQEIVFSLDALGNYQSFKNFLSLLENSSRLFEVGGVSFGSQVINQSSSSQGQTQLPVQQIYSFKLEIKTHSY